MPRSKYPIAKPKSKGRLSAPETADDVLAAGVDFEEAGEKWRAGDATKSCRFFVKALDTYEHGLQRYPGSFDLAYNRARLQFDLGQQPRLLALLPFSEEELLSKALGSHRYALQINPQNADTLFNVAQILTSLAEHVIQGPKKTMQHENARELLQNASDAFEKCLSIQMKHYNATQEALTTITSSNNQDLEPPVITAGVVAANAYTPEECQVTERWASIEEPTTASTLLDTCLAAVQSLKTMIPLLQDDQNELRRVEQARNNLMSQAETYLDRSDTIAVVEFRQTGIESLLALLKVSFALGRTEIEEYSRQISALFEVPELENSVELLTGSAEARINFGVTCIRARDADVDSNKLLQVAQLCWRQYSIASDHLTAATKLTNLSTPWRIYALKADVELLRSRLTEFDFAPANSNHATLLKNAEIFYRGAKNLAKSNEEIAAIEELSGRELVISALRGETELTPATEEILADMQEEGLIKCS